jgi:hypothetical protein
MYRSAVKAMVLASLAVLVAIPALAEVRAEIGPLHIRMASEAPPRVKSEKKTARSDRNTVWLNGYWHLQEQQWTWVSGRWEQPTQRHAWWVPAAYTREGSGWRYAPAHWSYENLIEGEEYRQWKNEHGSDRDGRPSDHDGHHE